MGSDKMAGLPRRIIKVTAQAGLRLPHLLFSAWRIGRLSLSLPPPFARRPEAARRGSGHGGEGSLALGRGRGDTSGRGGAAGRRRPWASRGPRRAGKVRSAPWWMVGLRGFSLGRGPPRCFRPPTGGDRGCAGITAGLGLWAGVVARHGLLVSDPPLGPGGSAGVRQPQLQNE